MSGFEPGETIDERYVIIEQIGEGGMGSVFTAREIGLERIVAIKVLQALSQVDAEARARFQREAKVLSALSHPGIVSFFRLGLWHGRLYMAMEYIEGHTLRKAILENKCTPIDAMQIAAQVCQAMQYAHLRGVYHRDLKPDNIVLTQIDGKLRVRLLDFGLARISESAEAGLTQTGLLVGSVAYMSPEQCTGQKVDHRADIYALGCILYEMIAGAPPFQTDNPVGMVYKHANDLPPNLVSRNNVSLPPGLKQAVSKCLEKSIQNRYQSMSELEVALQAVLRGEGSAEKEQGTKSRIFNSVPFTCAVTAILLLGLCTSSVRLFKSAPSEGTHITKVDRVSRRSNQGMLMNAAQLIIQSGSTEQRKVQLAQAEGLLNAVIDSERQKPPPNGPVAQAYVLRAKALLSSTSFTRNLELKHTLITQAEEDCKTSIAYSSRQGHEYKAALMGYELLGDISENDKHNLAEAEENFRKALVLYKRPDADELEDLGLVKGTGMPSTGGGDSEIWLDCRLAGLEANRGVPGSLKKLHGLLDKWLSTVGSYSVSIMTVAETLADAYKRAGMKKERRKLLEATDRRLRSMPSDIARTNADCFNKLANLNIADQEFDLAFDELRQAMRYYQDSFRTESSSMGLLKTIKRLKFSCGPDHPNKLAELQKLEQNIRSRPSD